jgi:heme-degrading monooxygenase HmoA
MRRVRPPIAALLLGLLPLLQLPGCAVARPLRVLLPEELAQGARLQSALVVLTHAVVDPAQRTAFDAHTRRVDDSLDAQPGLIAHSLRRELFGNSVWTMTIWTDAQASMRFSGSSAHAAAKREAGRALLSLRTVRLELPRNELPPSWERMLSELDKLPPATPP